MRRTIQYAIDIETGLTVSRVGSWIAFYELEYPGPVNENRYHLVKVNILKVAKWIGTLKWTKKISQQQKDIHRQFWGFGIL